MAKDVFPDPASSFGKRVRKRLRDEQIIWLTTVADDGTPEPNPVWFIDEGESLLIYNQLGAKRLDHIRNDPRVSLHFDGDGQGGDVVIFSGVAEIIGDETPANRVQSYMDKYGAAASEVSGDAAAFSEAYPTAMRIAINRVRGF